MERTNPHLTFCTTLFRRSSTFKSSVSEQFCFVLFVLFCPGALPPKTHSLAPNWSKHQFRFSGDCCLLQLNFKEQVRTMPGKSVAKVSVDKPKVTGTSKLSFGSLPFLNPSWARGQTSEPGHVLNSGKIPHLVKNSGVIFMVILEQSEIPLWIS